MINLKQLLYNSPQNKIFVSAWMAKQGIDRRSSYAYKKNGWLVALGRGAFIKQNASPILDLAIEALQKQLLLPVHVGGKSALNERYNITHFIQFKTPQTELFAPNKTIIPCWFKTTFRNQYRLILSDFLPLGLGIEEIKQENYQILVSSPERAFLELLYSVPQKISTKEAYQILELLPNLRPKLLNALLQQCKSIKVKRLFLYLASEINHDWCIKLAIPTINLGFGIRTIDKQGIYNKKYGLIINPVKGL